MGNLPPNPLQKECQAQRFKRVVSHTDGHLGKFSLVQFDVEPKTLYLQEDFNPTLMDKYATDLQDFIKCVLKKHKNICEFAFITSKPDQDVYDLVCEYGDAVFPNFHSEKLVWGFLSNVLNGLMFLQSLGLHYPLVHKRYTVFLAGLNCFKLVNPFCFPSFVLEVVSVYKNPSVPLLQKNKLFSDSITRNIREIGQMILCILFNVDDFDATGVPLAQIQNALRGQVTDALVDFLVYCLDVKSGQQQMNELAKVFSAAFGRAKEHNCGQVCLPVPNPFLSAKPRSLKNERSQTPTLNEKPSSQSARNITPPPSFKKPNEPQS